MIRWAVVIFFALALLPVLLPILQKWGVWRAPGDIRFKLFGILWCLPFGSTVLVTAFAFFLAKVL